jgi:hypothetical protein
MKCICCNSVKSFWKEGQPWAYAHEVGALIVAPVSKPRREPQTLEQLRARTDLNPGLKAMMIRNLEKRDARGNH